MEHWSLNNIFFLKDNWIIDQYRNIIGTTNLCEKTSHSNGGSLFKLKDINKTYCLVFGNWTTSEKYLQFTHQL